MQPGIFPIDISKATFRNLAVVPNSQGSPKVIQIVDPEFSSVCPKTGLPDYGRVILRYIPLKVCVELKDWKLYLRDFYGVGCFHEDVTQRIADWFKQFVDPQWFQITIDWSARGGLHTTTRLTWNSVEGYDADPLTDFDDGPFKKHAEDWNNR